MFASSSVKSLRAAPVVRHMAKLFRQWLTLRVVIPDELAAVGEVEGSRFWSVLANAFRRGKRT